MTKKLFHIVAIITIFQLMGNDLFASIEDKLNEKWRWSSYTTTEGLPSNNVLNILEANDGTIWACTPKGFAWYDNYIWHSVTIPGISSLSAYELNVTVAATKSGLLTCCNGSLYHIEKTKTKEIKFENKYILEAVVFDTASILIRGISDSKGKLYLLKNNSLQDYDFSGTVVTDKNKFLYRPKSGDLWFNTSGGLYKLTGDSFEMQLANEYQYVYNTTLLAGHESGKGYFGMGFPNRLIGIWEYARGIKPSILDFGRNYTMTTISINSKFDAVAVFYGGIVNIKEDEKWYFMKKVPNELSRAVRILFSEGDDLWIATDMGVFLCRLSSARWDYWYHKPASNLKNFVNEIIRDSENNLWVASGFGIEVYFNDGKYKAFEYIDGEKISGTTGLIEDNKGRIWISSGSGYTGVYYYENGKWSHLDIDEDLFVHKIKKDRNGMLWLMTVSGKKRDAGQGIWNISDSENLQLSKYQGLSEHRVYDFAEDGKGNKWFATIKGLYRFDGNRWTHWNMKSGLRNDLVYTIAVDSSDVVWFGEQNYGAGFIRNDSVKYTEALDSAAVLSVLNLEFDRFDKLWISTRNGLYSYLGGIVTHFNSAAGLYGNAVWPLQIEEDRIFVGTIGNGINVFGLSEKFEPLPKVFINNVSSKSDIYLINISAYAFFGQLPPEDIEIRYRLDDAEWSPWTKSRIIQYHNLSYREHVFSVQAKGLFGNISDNVVSRSFYVSPPVYLKPYFYIPLILFFIAFVYIIARVVINRRKYVKDIQKMNLELEDRVQKRTADLEKSNYLLETEIHLRKISEEKLRIAKEQINSAFIHEKELNDLKTEFISTISHKYRTPLTVISSSSELLKIHYEKRNEDKFDLHLRKIIRSVEDLISILNDIILVNKIQTSKLNVKLREINIDSFLRAVIDKVSVSLNKDIEIRYENKSALVMYSTDVILFEKICFAIIHNAGQFSNSKSFVSVSLSNNDNHIMLKISDSGIGIPKEDLSYVTEAFFRGSNIREITTMGLGLFIASSCTTALNGNLIISSVQNRGTEVLVELPKIYLSE